MSGDIQQSVLDILGDIRRITSLVALGLDDTPDVTLDKYTAMIRRHLDVPITLVSLVDDHHQYAPGASGISLEERSSPLRVSVCQNVVVSGEPVIADDLRKYDYLLGVHAAIAEMGVLAYAGFPLCNVEGDVLGSLCAVDTVPHEWTTYEIDTLRDFAAICASELHLRILVREGEIRYAQLRGHIQDISMRIEEQ